MDTMTTTMTPTWVGTAPSAGIVVRCALGVAYSGTFQGTGLSAADHGKRPATGGLVSRTRNPFRTLDVAPTLGRPPV